jgi:hypothetical protein
MRKVLFAALALLACPPPKASAQGCFGGFSGGNQLSLNVRTPGGGSRRRGSEVDFRFSQQQQFQPQWGGGRVDPRFVGGWERPVWEGGYGGYQYAAPGWGGPGFVPFREEPSSTYGYGPGGAAFAPAVEGDWVRNRDGSVYVEYGQPFQADYPRVSYGAPQSFSGYGRPMPFQPSASSYYGYPPGYAPPGYGTQNLTPSLYGPSAGSGFFAPQQYGGGGRY